jgi:hypothetical protein
MESVRRSRSRSERMLMPTALGGSSIAHGGDHTLMTTTTTSTTKVGDENGLWVVDQ